MGQKYTFFIKANSVTFREDEGFRKAKDMNDGSAGDMGLLAVWTKRIRRMQLEEDCDVAVGDLQHFMEQLFASFRVIRAAGGYVMNPDGQLLMIFRRGYWDLPKGKLDKGEIPEQAAVREVEEECAIGGLYIVSPPFDTYHVYEEAGETVIKQSTWYRMRTGDTIDPVPQEEEDITEALWVDLPVPAVILSGAYASIRAVITHFSPGP